ncbi:proton channel OtopLc-like [Oppia nitens]|uniref:proton channel OtopLc-like n=1 Tax=Oppia nitens TaxID=1686743 RepID=UPI0023DA5E20|nr:proton channel OtopLc-like [Oppia nitens]
MTAMKPRPASLSLVTVTSLEKKSSVFFEFGQRQRPNSFYGFSSDKNLNHFYESSSIETPTIIIDSGSEPELSITESVSDGAKQMFGKSVDNTLNKTNSIKYLTPPPQRSRRQPVDTISTISSTPTTTSALSKFSHRSISYNSKSGDGDDLSIGGCSIAPNMDIFPISEPNHRETVDMNNRLVKFMSIVYALVIIVSAAIICVYDLGTEDSDTNHLFMILINFVGFIWIAFLHWDILRYKRWAIDYLRPDSHESVNSEQKSVATFRDDISISTAIIFNKIQTKSDQNQNPSSTADCHQIAYRFLYGKHSGNFYLKCGMTVFCFGSIVHMGIQMFTNIFYYVDRNVKCQSSVTILFLIIRLVFSFYQLFIAFKYSNIIINRFTTLARFALMHLVGTSMASWFATIMSEAIDDFVHEMNSKNDTHELESDFFTASVKFNAYCKSKSIINWETLDAIPYFYPFTVEYNICIASVWYIIWTNVDKSYTNSHLHYVRQEVIENEFGEQEIEYRSPITISADCHASNRGLFSGLSAMLATFVTIVIFFTTQSYSDFGITIYTAQIAVLTFACCLVIPLAFRQIRRLDIVKEHDLDNSSTAMDDLLVLIPIPFFLLHYIHLILAAINDNTLTSWTLIVIYVLTMIQVIVQSPFIVDGIRRCSNSRLLRQLKPGRELITFALILNLTLWILNTFELKSLDKYHNTEEQFGQMLWMIISHTTVPLMLFYRFHSSVCLSDIWKYAYEKDENINHI